MTDNQTFNDLHAILNQSIAGIYVVQNGYMAYVNQTYATLLGYETPQEIINKIPVLDLVAPDSKDEAQKNIERRLRGTVKDTQYEVTLIKKDGTHIMVEAHGSQSEFNGKPAIMGVLIDRSTLKQAEQRLADSEKKLRRFIENSPAPVAMFDTEMRYIVASGSWFKEYSLDKTDIVGKSHYEVFPEIPEHWKDAHRQGLAGKTLKNDNDPFVREDGSTQWISWEIRPWCDIDGKVGGILIYTSDVTKYHQLEASLSLSEIKFKKIFDNAPLGMALVNDRGYPELSNKTLCDMLGYSPEELAGMSFFEFTHPDDASIDMEQYQELMAQRIDYYSMQKRYICKDGSVIWANLTVSAIFNSDGSVMYAIGMVDDITDRVDAAQKASQQEALLFHQNRMAVQGEMLHMIAHQWRQPLSTINATAMNIKVSSQLSPTGTVNDLENDMDKIMETSALLSDTIDVFRNIYKVSDHKKAFDITETIDKSVNLVKDLYKSKFSIMMEVDHLMHETQVTSLEQEIIQILLNLFSNSKDALIEKMIAAPLIRVVSECNTEFCIITVEDNGGGISEENIDRIFEPGFTTKGESGTGLGMHIVKTLVERKLLGTIDFINTDNGLKTTLIIPHG
jgi:PAS domain S-box-containing protein